MNVTTEQMVLIGAGVLLLMVAGHFFWRPMRWLFTLAFNSLLGVLMLGGTNLLGASFGLTLPLNPVSALIAGFLGIPGMALLLMLKYFMIL
ncbi:pro-sigmaK processing inhibitor BofA [Heliobacterium gestii]|uniref:Pro-sigmaK processing inhibitor BofA n=1 Tax=Heliomicrobium gestii TaxID=2699 RepID=A0A845LHH3_HELGE|nr:pro-sigmaK processing inhibitor BofA family protein [Heliomicrobium gestii]MBM7866297.1 inhibitor of the pro-sigma K processing machinery [Heliomicrobium gestii]MZP42913.1 pro-sigmaK processing inhibitor BofA [Heliomicrobium gestii]